MARLEDGCRRGMARKEGEGRKDGRRRGRKMRIQAMVTPEKVGERGGGVGGEGDVVVEVEDGLGGGEVVVAGAERSEDGVADEKRARGGGSGGDGDNGKVGVVVGGRIEAFKHFSIS
jgi:hypothetical protein